MRLINTVVATIVNATASGEEVAVDTVGTRDLQTGDARFHLNVTALTGTAPTMDLDITATIDSVDYVVGSFVQSVAGASVQSIVINQCPSVVKIEYTAGGTVTDFDATVTCSRL